MNKIIQNKLEALSLGDLVAVDWCDASVGKSSHSGMAIDILVKSWGIYVGLIGDKIKHIVLAQNSFRYSDGLFDLDYTAVPLTWTTEVSIITKQHIPKNTATELVNSFMTGGHRALYRPRISRHKLFQQRLSLDGRPN